MPNSRPKSRLRRAALVLLPLVGIGGVWATVSASVHASAAGRVQSHAVAHHRHPLSGLAVVPLTVSSANGRHRFRVEVAITPAQQEKGLMFRTAMGADEGMIFPYKQPQRVSFWMQNCPLALDIIFIGTDHRVLNIADARPFDETPLASAGAVSNVLELTNGRAAALGIRPGDRVDW